MQDLEKVFGVPVLESYGMTEAAHQMASNPLPPGKRFAGSVGIASGPEIAIMDEAGNILKANDIGEVVIRGRDVFAGYENNPDANAKAWSDGWFRTGDQGYLDEAGYLRLTGRLKELINRGGEKVSPVEVETRAAQSSPHRASGGIRGSASDARRRSGGRHRAARGCDSK